MKKLALVIGNSEYKNSGVLFNPTNDANDIANTLQDLGFDVMKYIDLTNNEMIIYINEYLKKLAEYSVGVVYYAGHGMQIRGKNYLVPIDCQLTSEEATSLSCFALEDLLGKLDIYSTKINIIILDACRTNPFSNRLRGTMKNEFASITNPPQGTLISFSTSPDRPASDGENKNGLFTGVLKEYLRIPNIKVEEMFKHVRRSVIELSAGEQIPWEHSSLTGDFYFDVQRIPVSFSFSDEEIYNFIEEYWKKHMATSSNTLDEGMAYIEAQNKFNLPIIEILRAHSRIAYPKLNFSFEDSVIDELNMKYLSTWGFKYENYRWYYKGNYVRMGDPLPLNHELEMLPAIEGEEIEVDFNVSAGINKNYVFFKAKTNLPDHTPILFSLQSKNSLYSAQSKVKVQGNMACSGEFTNRGELLEDGAYILSINSPIYSIQPKEVQARFGERNRNLIGRYVKFNPIGGKTIDCKLTILKKEKELIIIK